MFATNVLVCVVVWPMRESTESTEKSGLAFLFATWLDGVSPLNVHQKCWEWVFPVSTLVVRGFNWFKGGGGSPSNAKSTRSVFNGGLLPGTNSQQQLCPVFAALVWEGALLKTTRNCPGSARHERFFSPTSPPYIKLGLMNV